MSANIFCMKLRLLRIIVCSSVFLFLSLFFIGGVYASIKDNHGRSIKSLVFKDEDITKIISSGKLECENNNSNIHNKKQKKIIICPINNSENGGILSISSKKFLTTYFYKIRNLIYIICFMFLLFIWARIRWQKFPEWKLFYSVFMILVITTIASGIVNWYFVSDDIYLYHCQKPGMLWQLCKKGKNSIAVMKKNLIVLDSNGKVLKTKFISNRNQNRYKVNMFY